MSLLIAKSATISNLADIEDSIIGSEIIVGEHTKIDSFVKIKPAGGTGNVVIGNDCYINSGCVLYSGNGIKIGNNVLIAANSTLCPTNHEIKNLSIPIRLQGFKESRGGIVIEDDVWIGANCVLLDGAYISTGAVIAAGSIVNSHVKPFSIYAGSPAKFLKKRT